MSSCTYCKRVYHNLLIDRHWIQNSCTCSTTHRWTRNRAEPATEKIRRPIPNGGDTVRAAGSTWTWQTTDAADDNEQCQRTTSGGYSATIVVKSVYSSSSFMRQTPEIGPLHRLPRVRTALAKKDLKIPANAGCSSTYITWWSDVTDRVRSSLTTIERRHSVPAEACR